MKKEAMFYKKLPDAKAVRCGLCSQVCKIETDEFGFCGVRQNLDGVLYTHVYGVTIARHVDPIEKKPLYHFLPGSRAFSIGTVGCNFHCGFCQNWQISQTTGGRMTEADWGQPMPPDEVVAATLKSGCKSIAYTYTEPTIFFEYAYDTAMLARENGIRNVFVSNGYMTAQAIDVVVPYLDAANIDLKAWSDDYYRNNCQGRLKPVLNSIRQLKAHGIWVEITTLLIPGENDTDEQLHGIAEFIAEVDPHMPWHISAFHPTYKFTDRPFTPLESLEKARKIGLEKGLHYVYLGNVAVANNTMCPECGEAVILRPGHLAEAVNLEDGKCMQCKTAINGVWK